MTEARVLHAESIEAYSGPHAIDGIRFRPAAATLGVKAWGMNILDIDAGCEGHPEHDHTGDGQEEVYVILRGSGTLVVDGARLDLKEGDLAWVPPNATRKLLPGANGISVLALGGTPGQPFKSMLG